jgi:hypothetical protein
MRLRFRHRDGKAAGRAIAGIIDACIWLTPRVAAADGSPTPRVRVYTGFWFG